MTVLHLISSGGMYGAEAVILNLARQMKRNGHRHVLGVFDNSSNSNLALHHIATREGIESHTIPCNGRVDTNTTRLIRELADNIGADVVHTHGYKADLYGYFAMRRTGIALVATCHLWADSDITSRIYGFLDRFVLRRFSAAAAVSEAIMVRMVKSGISAEKITVIPNGIECEPFASRSAKERAANRGELHSFTVGFAARLSHEKGVDLLLETIQDVLKQLPATQFVIAGDGEERQATEKAITEKNLAGNVTLLGRCEDMPGFFASLDVLFSSSRNEGLPVALLEGMASGTAIVATAVGDVPTIIRNEETGLLVQPLDVPAMIAAVIRMLEDEALRERLAKAGQTLVREEFSAERMASRYEEFYQRAISKNRHSR